MLYEVITVFLKEVKGAFDDRFLFFVHIGTNVENIYTEETIELLKVSKVLYWGRSKLCAHMQKAEGRRQKFGIIWWRAKVLCENLGKKNTAPIGTVSFDLGSIIVLQIRVNPL